MTEKRSHHRFAIALPIQVWQEGAPVPIDAHFRDLCWGGASFTTTHTSLQPGERMVVRFPWTQGESLAIRAEVLRTKEIASGRWEIGVCFIHLAHRDERRLLKLLDLLAGKGQGPSLPLAPVLEIVLDDEEEFEDKLSQIAQGHLTLTIVGAGYQAGQGLLLLIGQTYDAAVLSLRAHIIEAIEIPPLDPFSAAGRPPIMELKLCIAHPLTELRRLAESFRTNVSRGGSHP